jgi:hypothetical protein
MAEGDHFHKLDEIDDILKKKNIHNDIVYSDPKGLIWDGIDYNCA